MYLKTYNKKECCGCTACEQVCPKNAISIVQIDNEGFKYPIIDNTKCVNCNLCEKVCPVEHPIYINNNTPDVYAALLKDVVQRQQSSSGGLFYTLSSWILNQGGIVYGAAFDKDLVLKHERVSSIENLGSLRGSKYLQSDLGNTFRSVEDDLKNNKWVYFVGTPCQVAGLKNYLKKKYTTLLTSDLVCHGVPSQALFNQHLHYLQKKNKRKIVSYAFRDNKKWGVCEIFEYYNENGKKKYKKLPSYDLSPYLYSFMHGYTYRESCYDCRFARIPRQGDITLADFWGVKCFFPEIDISKGVSLILVNTERGQHVWNAVKNDCVFFSTTLEDGGKYNRNLQQTSVRPPIRSHIFDDIKLYGYEHVAETTFRCPHWKRNYIVFKIQSTPLYMLLRKIRKHIRNFKL